MAVARAKQTVIDLDETADRQVEEDHRLRLARIDAEAAKLRHTVRLTLAEMLADPASTTVLTAHHPHHRTHPGLRPNPTNGAA